MKTDFDRIAEKIIKCSKNAEAEMIRTRRDIHQHPELGNYEFRTAGIIEKRLKSLGVDEVYTGLAGSTGVLGIIHGNKSGTTKGLRADMDALPIKENTGLPFASTETMVWGDQGNVPVMHACGHDCHVAMLLAAAEVIVNLRDELSGDVVLIFQPAEEGKSSDWNKDSGAVAFLNDPVFKNNVKLDSSLCLHVAPHLPAGSAGRITFHKGTGGYYMYIVRIVIKGKGGHANRYWLTNDPIAAAAQVITAVQGLIGKTTDPNSNRASFTVGMISGGSKFNVIPDETIIEGALRVTDKEVQAEMWQNTCATIQHVSAAYGCTAEITYDFCPAVYNDPDLADKLDHILTPILGEKYVTSAGDNTGMDDYSHFQMEAPGVWARLSVAPDEYIGSNLLHSSTMMVNEKGLINGVIALATFALKQD